MHLFTGLIGQKNLHDYFVRLSEKYGPIFSIQIGNVPHVVVNNADLALEIYVKKMGQFVDRPVQFSGTQTPAIQFIF